MHRNALAMALALALGLILATAGAVHVHADGYHISIGSTEVTAGDPFTLPVLAEWEAALQGYSLSVALPDPLPVDSIDLTVDGTIVGALLPDFFVVNFTPGEMVAGLLFDNMPPFTGTQLDPTGMTMAIAEFEGVVSASAATQELTFTPVDGLGDPATSNTFVVANQSVLADSLSGGTLTVNEFVDPNVPLFLRGDGYVDNILDISDIIYVLIFIFVQGPEPLCMDASDANDDGTVNVADAIFMVQYLFLQGAHPPAPFGTPGPDPTPDALDCEHWVGMP